MTTLGQFRRSFSKVYPNLYFRVGENKYNDKTLLTELSNTDNPISDWNEFAIAADIKEIIEAWLNLSVDFYFEKAPGSRPRYIKIEEVELATPIADLNEKVVIKGAVDLTYWAQGNGFDSLEDKGLNAGAMLGESEGSIGEDSSSELYDSTMKNLYYMTFYLYCDADGIELTESENAAETILEKINTINSFIHDRIDNEVKGFIYEEFLTSFDTLESRSIKSLDLLEFIKNKLKTASIKDSIESGESIRAAFIFDPKEDQIEVWKDEFMELSQLVEMTISIYGNHYEYSDIVTQTYDNGDYDTGIIACDQEVIDDLSLSDYMKSENPDSFPSDSIFEVSNYIK